MTAFSNLATPTDRMRADRTFFLGMALAIAATVVVGFAWSFFRTNLARQLSSTWVQAHAITFVTWIVLFVCQTALVASNRIEVHRRLGVAGAGLAGLMVALAIGSAVGGFLASPPRPLIDYLMLYVVLHVDIIMFAGFVILGLLLRRNPETHKRLMLLATVALLDAVTERLPLIRLITPYASYIVTDMFVVSAIIYDLISRRRVSPIYVWGGLIILIFPPAARIIFAAVTPHLVGVSAG